MTPRIDAVTCIAASHRVSCPPPPRSAKIEVTSRCNQRCDFCPNRRSLENRGDMRWPLFTRLVGQLVDAGVRELGLYYIGEPFLCDWLPDAIGYAKARGITYTFVATNGSVATPDRVRACMENGLDSLKFSMNNTDEEQFRRVTGAQPRLFHDAIANLQAARGVRDGGDYHCGIYASSVWYEDERQRRMQELVDRILPFVDEHYWIPLYSTGSIAQGKGQELAGPIRAGNKGRIGRLRDPLPCWPLFNQAHITWDGKLSACCFDSGDRWIMGDLERSTFLEAWNSGPFQRLREAHLRRDVSATSCAACVAYS